MIPHPWRGARLLCAKSGRLPAALRSPEPDIAGRDPVGRDGWKGDRQVLGRIAPKTDIRVHGRSWAKLPCMLSVAQRGQGDVGVVYCFCARRPEADLGAGDLRQLTDGYRLKRKAV